MSNAIKGGAFFDSNDSKGDEYLPNQGVFLAGMLGKGRGDAFGLYRGRIEPGSQISTEIHPETSETIYVLAGRAVGFIEDQEIPLEPGQVMHVDKNVHHGIRNVGDDLLEVIVIGHPDF
jgi:mannose-6-phosphate isomerase-like protein (cupin superfamily)